MTRALFALIAFSIYLLVLATLEEAPSTGDALLRECEAFCSPHVVLECSPQKIVCSISASREP